ncbi:MAG TPA: discoidin domain-containing protein [Catenuloplanes sp.]|jgi:hypothetical protein
MSLCIRARFGTDHRPRHAAAVAALTSVALAATAALTGPATAAPPTPSTTRTTPATLPSQSVEDDAALKAAQASGQPVEILSRRTNDSEVYREPSGLFSLVQHTAPVRVRDGQRWVDVDLKLKRHPDGTVRPAAAPVAVTLSGGGTGPFARLDSAGARVALSWPGGPLPRPKLTGSTATYRNVLPEVDLQVTATLAGFTEVFVVRTPKAAKNPTLAALKLGFATEGLTVHNDPTANTLTGVNPAGEVVFQTATPMMWGSATQATAAEAPARTKTQNQDEPAAPPLLSELGLRIAKNELTLIPDATLRTAGPEAFPISIDPEVMAGHAGNWTTTVSGQFKNSKFWGTGLPAADNAAKGNVKVGRAPGLNVETQSYFQMGTKHVNGKIIESAKFEINALHAWNCANRPPMQLALTGPISPNTTWERRPAWHGDKARHPKPAPCPTGWYTYDVTDLVQTAAAANWPNLTVGLRAQDGNDEKHWRRFRADGKGPIIKIQFREVPPPPVNRPPDPPAGLTSPSAPTCGSIDHPVRVGAGDLRFTARLTDPDDDSVQGFLGLWSDGHTPVGPVSGLVASGTTVSWNLPAGALRPNVVYNYAAHTQDAKGLWGDWNTPRCYLVQDTTPPEREPVVTSTDYPADPDHAFGSIGRTGSFTIDRDGVADVSHFLYGTQDPPAMRADLGPNGTATVNITPTTPQVNTLYARSVDIAGNRGPVRRYTFNVAGGTPPVGYWRFNERAGTTVADVEGRHDVTVTGGNRVPARPGDTGRAYQFNGAGDHAQTAGPVTDTTKSFSIAAWAKVQNTNSGTGLQSVVAPVGNQRSPFSLVYNTSTRRWELSLRTTDASNAADPARTNIASDVVDPGSWYHLAATYDAGTRQARLYVNGVLVEARSHHITFNATGPLQIGRSKNDGAFGEHFGGLVDDVWVWDRVAQPDELLGIASDGETSRTAATATSPGPPCAAHHTADKAIDGSIAEDSKWCTNDLQGRILYLDLVTDTTLRAVAIRHAGAGGETHQYNSKDFDLQVSTDGLAWTGIGTYRGNTAANTVLTLPEPITASYLRLVIHTPTQFNDPTARIYELEVYGSPWTITNTALGKPATSEAPTCNTNQTADRLTDGVTTVAAGWCATRTPATAQIDLGSTTDIRWIALRHAEAGGGPPNQNTRDYEVHTSTDGNTWTTVADVQTNTQPVSGHALALPIAARYVRVVIANPSQNGEITARLPELEVYASE